jgi:hypothetical protein
MQATCRVSAVAAAVAAGTAPKGLVTRSTAAACIAATDWRMAAVQLKPWAFEVWSLPTFHKQKCLLVMQPLYSLYAVHGYSTLSHQPPLTGLAGFL